MRARLAVTTTALLLLLSALALPAFAVERRPEPPPLEEIGTQSEISQRFFPEGAEEQPFTEVLVYPLMAIGVLACLVILYLYLKWQPRFAREREEPSRR